jgi:DNA polymerase-1
MVTTDGFHVNAIHGWIRSLWKLEDLISPDAVCVFFDSGGSNLRKSILSTYKANRKSMPDDLRRQLEYMNLLSIAHGYYVVVREGTEADDMLASFARKVSECGEMAYIASGDKDFAQCVGGNIFQILPPTVNKKEGWKIVDRAGVREKFGVFPEQIVDYLSLCGDSSDSIPGVKGIGAKRAEMFLNQFGDANALLNNVEKIPPSAVRIALANSRDLINRNRELIELKGTLDFNLPETKIHRNVEDILGILKTLQLHSLLTMAEKRFSTQGELFAF